MRKGILVILVSCLTGLEMAHAQPGPFGGYQEPLPIQSPGMRYGAGQYPAPVPSRYPSYAPPPPNFVPMQPAPVYWVPPGYNVPMGWQPNAGYNPQVMNPPMGGNIAAYDPGAVSVAAQEKLPAPKQGEKEKEPPLQQPSPAPGDNPQAKPLPQSTDNLPPTSEVPVPAMVSEGWPVLVGPPPDPAEPFMVSPESCWKMPKGYRVYGSVDYLYWSVKAQPVPGNLNLSLANQSAMIPLQNQDLNGLRSYLGVWLTPAHNLSLEGGYLFLGSRGTNNSQFFPPVPLTIKPIFDGIVMDSTQAAASTSFQEAELNLRYQACRFRCGPFAGHLDLLGGFRFVDLSEALTIGGTTVFGTAPTLLSNANITTTDTFGTHNHLFAGQFGTDVGLNWGRWGVNAYGKLALGDNRETVTINGNTVVTGPPVLGNFNVPGGFFAQTSNIGSYRHDEFSIFPETGVNLSFQLCDHCRLAVGYTFAYFYHVVRPGEQIDPTAGGAARPPLAFLGGAAPQPVFNNFNETPFWAQGINLTVEVNY
jgi:hypothetical protein